MDYSQWRQIACFGRARVFAWYSAEYCRQRGGVCLLHHRRWRWADKMRSRARIRWVKAVAVPAHIPKAFPSPVSCNFKSGYGPEDQMHASNCRHDYPARAHMPLDKVRDEGGAPEDRSSMRLVLYCSRTHARYSCAAPSCRSKGYAGYAEARDCRRLVQRP
jgi:hypothetical protein